MLIDQSFITEFHAAVGNASMFLLSPLFVFCKNLKLLVVYNQLITHHYCTNNSFSPLIWIFVLEGFNNNPYSLTIAFNS